MSAIAEEILKYTANLPEGTVLTAKGLSHLGSRAAVDQALGRLSREGKLLRVARGRYARPIISRLGVRPPAPEKVVEGLAKLTGETIAPSGSAAANSLGLTTQVPIRRVYLTSGKSRRVQVGAETVELKHAPAWQLRISESKAGRVVRALAWLGEENAKKSLSILSSLAPDERRKLLEARSTMPGWMAEFVGTALASKKTRSRSGAVHG